MSRSLGWSLLIHGGLLTALLLVWAWAPASVDPPPESTVLARPMKIVPRPEVPKMVAGDGRQEAAPQPEMVLSPPAPPSPKKKPAPSSKLPESADSTAPVDMKTAARPLLSEPNYPTHQAKPNQGAPGDDPVSSEGKKKGKDRPAIPYHKPTISLEEQTGRDQILVRFEVAENGTCQVEMLEGTGDIHRDARVLNILRRWKWLPMRIDGQTYPSVEVLRFYRRDL